LEFIKYGRKYIKLAKWLSHPIPDHLTHQAMRTVHWLLWCLLIFLAGKVLSAQRPAPQPATLEIREVIPAGEAGFYTFSSNHPEKPDRGEITRFNFSQESLAQRTIPFERSPLKAQFEAVFFWDSAVNVLSSLYYPGPKRNHLLLYQYDANDLSEKKSAVMAEAYTPELYRVPFGYSLSPNGQYLAIYAWTYTLPKDPARLSVKVFGPGLTPVWSGEYQLPLLNEGLYLYDCKLTNQGIFYMLAENYLGKPGPQIDERKIQYLALAFNKDLKEPLAYFLNNPNDKLNGVKWDLSPAGILLAAAFFTDKGKLSPSGYLTYQVSEPGAEPKIRRYFLSEESYQMAYPYSPPEARGNANRRRFEQYAFQQLRVDNAGAMTLIAEQNVFDPVNGSLEFNDLSVVPQAKKEEAVWMRRIPKRQQGYSYIERVTYGNKAIGVDENLFFLFNDALKNQRSGGKNPLRERYEGGMEAMPVYRLNHQGILTQFDATASMREAGLGAFIPDKIWLAHDHYLLVGGVPLNKDEGSIRLVGIDLEAVLRKMQ